MGAAWLLLLGANHALFVHFNPELWTSMVNAVPDLVLVGLLLGGFVLAMALAAFLGVKGKLPGTRRSSNPAGFPVIIAPPPEDAG
jgi:hypothetical protein